MPNGRRRNNGRTTPAKTNRFDRHKYRAPFVLRTLFTAIRGDHTRCVDGKKRILTAVGRFVSTAVAKRPQNRNVRGGLFCTTVCAIGLLQIFFIFIAGGEATKTGFERRSRVARNRHIPIVRRS